MIATSSLKGLPGMVANGPPLQEDIARAIFEHRYQRDWDKAKVHDQWLALSSWNEATAVLRVLPLAVRA